MNTSTLGLTRSYARLIRIAAPVAYPSGSITLGGKSHRFLASGAQQLFLVDGGSAGTDFPTGTPVVITYG